MSLPLLRYIRSMLSQEEDYSILWGRCHFFAFFRLSKTRVDVRCKDLFLRDSLPFLEDDVCLDRLPSARVRHTNHCRLLYFGVFEQNRFDFGGVDVEAACDNHIFVAV